LKPGSDAADFCCRTAPPRRARERVCAPASTCAATVTAATSSASLIELSSASLVELSSASLIESAVVNIGVVFDPDLAALLVRVEDAAQLGEHRLVRGVSGERDVRSGEQTPFESVEVEQLKVVELLHEVAGREKFSETVRVAVGGGDLRVVRAEASEKRFVVAQERG
jgi:hypothetical protein